MWFDRLRSNLQRAREREARRGQAALRLFGLFRLDNANSIPYRSHHTKRGFLHLVDTRFTRAFMRSGYA